MDTINCWESNILQKIWNNFQLHSAVIINIWSKNNSQIVMEFRFENDSHIENVYNINVNIFTNVLQNVNSEIDWPLKIKDILKC